MGFCFVSEDVFTRSCTTAYCEGKARRNEAQTPTYQNANRWSLGYGIQRTIDLYFVVLVYWCRLLECFPCNTRWYRFGKHICEKITKIQQHPLNKYDGYDIREVFEVRRIFAKHISFILLNQSVIFPRIIQKESLHVFNPPIAIHPPSHRMARIPFDRFEHRNVIV